mmetsp:Transcript_13861/g.39450  ORF Transcript_13861/g.39450 Transcript_13861/m.39450 type:complete len:335 (-) Transcript_13861:896-1900(-)
MSDGASIIPNKIWYSILSAWLPYLVSTLLPARESAVAARRSPRVRAPSCCRRFATAEANLFSPAMLEFKIRKRGGTTWFERWLRPSCCTVLSALQANSKVMWALRLWLATDLSLCRLMPAEAASEMMQTSLSPLWKARLSSTLTMSKVHASSRRMQVMAPVPGCRISLFRRPVISATCAGPPRLSMSVSRGFSGSSRALASARIACTLKLSFGRKSVITFSMMRAAGSTKASNSASSPRLARRPATRASPVVCRPITTAWPDSRYSLAILMTSGTLAAVHSCLKKRCMAANMDRIASDFHLGSSTLSIRPNSAIVRCHRYTLLSYKATYSWETG